MEVLHQMAAAFPLRPCSSRVAPALSPFALALLNGGHKIVVRQASELENIPLVALLNLNPLKQASRRNRVSKCGKHSRAQDIKASSKV